MNVLDSFSLKGKTALLTGGAGLYGRQMTAALCEAGATVFIASRNLEKLQEAAAHCQATALRLDLESDASIAETVAAVYAAPGRILCTPPAVVFGHCRLRGIGPVDGGRNAFGPDFSGQPGALDRDYLANIREEPSDAEIIEWTRE